MKHTLLLLVVAGLVGCGSSATSTPVAPDLPGADAKSSAPVDLTNLKKEENSQSESRK